MTVNENEATAAVDAAAQAFWRQHVQSMALDGEESLLVTWEEMDAVQKQSVRQHVLPFVWAAMEALDLTSEWGRRIKDGSMGNGHMVGHVSSLYKTREAALAGGNGEGIFGDQELVVRRVSPWEATA